MGAMETILLRTYSQSEKNEAVTAFQQLNLSDNEIEPESITLYKDTTFVNDLYMIINWVSNTYTNGKSPLGKQLAHAFSDFGQIKHFCLIQECKFDIK